MSLRGIQPVTASPPKLGKQLREKITKFLQRYSMAEVLTEIARQRPSFDLCVTGAVKDKGICKECGTQLENGHGK